MVQRRSELEESEALKKDAGQSFMRYPQLHKLGHVGQ
jgi:hypothetical protein